MVAFLRERADRLRGARRAMVVNSSKAHGLGRKIETSIESDGIEIRMFADDEEGLARVRAERERRS